MGDLNELVAWLVDRAKPDSGIVYGDNSRGIAEATFHGYDAAFVAERFHGKGAAVLAAALTSLIAERDGRPKVFCAMLTTGACDKTDRITDLEAQLKAAREHIDLFCQINCQDAQAIADAQIAALSLDTNKGDAKP